MSLFTNLAIDKKIFSDDDEEGAAVGFLMPFFVAAGIGVAIYFAWSLWSLMRLATLKTD